MLPPETGVPSDGSQKCTAQEEDNIKNGKCENHKGLFTKGTDGAECLSNFWTSTKASLFGLVHGVEDFGSLVGKGGKALSRK